MNEFKAKAGSTDAADVGVSRQSSRRGKMELSKSRDEGMTRKLTVCQMCSYSCPGEAYVNAEGRLVRLDGDFCRRGQHQLDLLYNENRLKHPVVRENGEFRKASWDEALERIAENLIRIRNEHGPESVIFFAGYPKEGRPYFQRLSYLFGSPHYMTEESFCFSATHIAASLNYGTEYGFFYLSGRTGFVDTKCYLCWASNPGVSIPPSNYSQFVAARKNGMKLVVVDTRRTEMAELADLHLQPRPGTDGALALGFMHVIINHGSYDKEFVEKWTVGFEGLRTLAQSYPPERVSEITAVPAEDIVEAARMYAADKPSKLQTSSCSTVQTTNGVQNHRAILLLPALTGNLDVPGGNCMPDPKAKTKSITLFNDLTPTLKPQSGAGKYPVWFKYYQEGQANEIIEQILTDKPYPIKAMVSLAANIGIWPNTSRVKAAIDKLEFFSAIDYFQTPTTDKADVVLPSATWLERSALMAKPGGIMFLREPTVEPLHEAWPDWKFAMELGKKLGLGDQMWNGDFDACVNEMLEPTGLTVDELRQSPEGIRAPATERGPKCYEKMGFSTPSGKVEFSSSVLAENGYDPFPIYQEPAESPVSAPEVSKEFPMVLTTGGRHKAFTHSQFHSVPKLKKLMPDLLVQISVEDAAARGISSGDSVTVRSKRGQIPAKADVVDLMKPGVVHVYHGWQEDDFKFNANQLTDDGVHDPISAFPAFKTTLCEVSL